MVSADLNRGEGCAQPWRESPQTGNDLCQVRTGCRRLGGASVVKTQGDEEPVGRPSGLGAQGAEPGQSR